VDVGKTLIPLLKKDLGLLSKTHGFASIVTSIWRECKGGKEMSKEQEKWDRILNGIPRCLGKGLLKEYGNELGTEQCLECVVNNLCAAILEGEISLDEVRRLGLEKVKSRIGNLQWKRRE
jgi:hypothetical protein